MKQSPFPRPRLCCPRAASGTTGSPPPCRPDATSPTAYTRPSLPERPTAGPGPARASPLPAPAFPTMPIPLPRGVHDRCNPGSTRRPWPSPRIPGLGSPLSPRTGLASRSGRIHITLRPGRSLPPKGPSTLGFNAGRFPPTPPACYPAPWHLPGPDFHRHGRCELIFESGRPSWHHLTPNRGHTKSRLADHCTVPAEASTGCERAWLTSIWARRP
jgi:hypothetical protein